MTVVQIHLTFGARNLLESWMKLALESLPVLKILGSNFHYLKLFRFKKKKNAAQDHLKQLFQKNFEKTYFNIKKSNLVPMLEQ